MDQDTAEQMISQRAHDFVNAAQPWQRERWNAELQQVNNRIARILGPEVMSHTSKTHTQD